MKLMSGELALAFCVPYVSVPFDWCPNQSD